MHQLHYLFTIDQRIQAVRLKLYQKVVFDAVVNFQRKDFMVFKSQVKLLILIFKIRPLNFFQSSPVSLIK